jgi:uncharacterized repeat protein (TIGR01451 family)
MKRILSYVPKKALALAIVAGAVLGVSAAVSAWGPDRPTYTVNNPADHVTFNSITDNPNYGDERAFFDVKPTSNTTSGGYVDKIKVKDGDELLIRTYVHNNAATSLNGTNYNGVGVAKNTNLRIYLPTAAGTALRANAYISADNASPKTVNDTVDFYGDNNFSLTYEAGSAVAYNNAHPTGMKLADSIVSTGAPLGYESANGVFPGCFQYINIVTIKVKVHMQTPDFTVAKTVSKIQSDGKYTWGENVVVNPGETVAYQIRFTNTGNTQLDNVILRDQLPKGFKIVPGSTLVKYGSDPTVKPAGNDGIVSNGGLMVGSYASKGGAVAMFKAVAPSNSDLVCGANKLTNVAEARVGSMATTDTADVTINRTEGCDHVTPAYSCDALGYTVIGERKVSVTTNYTAINGATLNNISYDFGDGTAKLVTKNTTVEHQYAADGTYTIRATPSFTVNGKVVTADSVACAKVVTFSKGEVVTPPTTTPSTGPTETIGLFVGASILSAIGYRLWMIRRLGN